MKFYALGFGLCTTWLWLLFLQGPLLEQAAQSWDLSCMQLFFLFLLSHSLMSFALSSHTALRKKIFSAKPFALAVFLLPLLSLFILEGPGYLPVLPHIFLFIPAIISILAGMSAAPLFISWMEKFGHLPLTEAAKALAYSLCLAAVLTIGSIFMPSLIGVILVAICPVLSFFFWKKLSANETFPTSSIIELPLADFLTTRLIILVALLYIAGGSIFSAMTLEQDFPYLFYLSNSTYASGCLVAVFLIKKSAVPDLHNIFFPVLPLIGTGFLLFPLMRPGYTWIAFAVLQSGVAFLDMYTWLLFSSLSRLHKDSFAVCSLGLGIITFFICGGNALSFILSSWISDISRLNMICLIAGIACLLAINFFHTTPLFRKIPSLSLQETVPAIPATAKPDDKTVAAIPVATVEEIHDRYRIGGLAIYLTPREKQVLFLLARGYGYKAITEKLIISNNTVKFHIRNIYTKFDVTNRHDLLEKLVAREKDSL